MLSIGIDVSKEKMKLYRAQDLRKVKTDKRDSMTIDLVLMLFNPISED